MITTLPGTYIHSAAIHAAAHAAGLADVHADATEEPQGAGVGCTADTLRATNLVFAVLNVFAIHRCLSWEHPAAPRSGAVATLNEGAGGQFGCGCGWSAARTPHGWRNPTKS